MRESSRNHARTSPPAAAVLREAKPDSYATEHESWRCLAYASSGSAGPHHRSLDRISSDVGECRILVIDTQASAVEDAHKLSGGEKVIIGNAVSLALSMTACRRKALEVVTLVQNQSRPASDSLNARVYMAMLRRAAAVPRTDSVFFVSDSREAVAMANARIEIRVAP